MWQLTVIMRQGKEHVLSFDGEDGAKAALAEVNDALTTMGHAKTQPVTIAGRLVVIPGDVRSAEISEWSVGVA